MCIALGYIRGWKQEEESTPREVKRRAACFFVFLLPGEWSQETFPRLMAQQISKPALWP